MVQVSWAIFFLVLFGGLGRFADFVLGVRGQRQLRRRLADWYVATAEGDWTDLMRYSAISMDTFLSRFLGQRTFSVGAVLRVAAFGMALDVLLILIALIAGMDYSVAPQMYGWRAILISIGVLLLSNTVIDSTTFALARQTYRQLASHPTRVMSLGVVVIDAVLAYFAITATALLAFPSALFFVLGGSTEFGLWLKIVGTFAPNAFIDPFHANIVLGNFNLGLFAISAALPTLMHLSIFMALLIAQLLRPLVQRPLTIALERLEDAPNGLLTTLGLFLGALATIISAMVSAIGGSGK